MIIIGLAGKAKSGKDTFYNMCKNIIKHPTEKLAFADSLKEEVAKGCGISVELIEINKTIFRPVLQWWGTDFRRNLTAKNYWIDKVRRKLVDLPDETVFIFITDVRFINEAEWIKSVHGYMIRIARERDTGNHPSEVEMDSYKDYDFIIDNTYSLGHLRNEALRVLKSIRDQITIKKKKIEVYE